MKYTKKIQKALNVCAEKHLGQSRRGVKRPYVIHPYSVAIILSEYTSDEDIVSAALLHDVLEDVVGYTYADIERDFGSRVASLVFQVSEDKRPELRFRDKETWKARKLSYLESIKNAHEDALMICAADKMHNMQSMMDDYAVCGDEM